MNRNTIPLFAAALLVVSAPLSAQAEFLDPDWSAFSIEGVAAPDWIAGENDGNYIALCTACEGTMMFEVKVLPDDGTGGRVASGETTADRFTEIGSANAATLGGDADYYGTEDIEYGSAQGFSTRARGATGDYSATYQLWNDGKQLLIRVYGADQAEVDAMASKVYEAAAPVTFR
ncbi:hypothetical protein [Devosia rhizoryzae]|uniref:Uncharacterized protein n=1 Tax=Devosia rhizoryzae TaxID=2774137 RepID=A0ABX7CBD3_9HYPH|nr:hypothetical protein [Devosia rhizoryzae]QQR40494.1 hypothetical protein JI748_05715 [Devosia rhizoryzae]